MSSDLVAHKAVVELVAVTVAHVSCGRPDVTAIRGKAATLVVAVYILAPIVSEKSYAGTVDGRWW